jgi:3',5'-cyclic-AMP phosphodiesterase
VSARVVIAQISDLHIKPPGELAYGRIDTAAALARCIDSVNRFAPRPDLVVITGDLVDKPLPQAYNHLKVLLGSLQIPFVAVPGNHDGRDLMRVAFASQRYAGTGGVLNAVRAVGGIDIVLIDSTVPDEPYGLLAPETLAWLDSALAASETRPALLFLHHPPIVTGIRHMDFCDSTTARG